MSFWDICPRGDYSLRCIAQDFVGSTLCILALAGTVLAIVGFFASLVWLAEHFS